MCTPRYNNCSKDVPDDSDTNPSVAVDVRTTNDLKFYFISLALTIMTMVLCKLIWSLFKSISFKIVNSIDSIDALITYRKAYTSRIKGLEKRSNNVLEKESIAMIPPSVKLKIRRSVSSNTSLRNVSLSSNDNNVITRCLERSDSDMSRVEKGTNISSSSTTTSSRSPSPPFINK